MTNEVPKSPQDLREMVYHTDARVTAMEGQLAGIASQLNRTDSKMDQVINAINQPKDVNWLGIGSLGLSLIVSLFGGAAFVVRYTGLTQEPIVDKVGEIAAVLSDQSKFQMQTHYEVGRFSAKDDEHSSEIARLWDHIHKQELVDGEQNDRLARSEVARKAIGDYVRQIDELGSRRWMNDQPRRASQVEAP